VFHTKGIYPAIAMMYSGREESRRGGIFPEGKEEDI